MDRLDISYAQSYGVIAEISPLSHGWADQNEKERGRLGKEGNKLQSEMMANQVQGCLYKYTCGAFSNQFDITMPMKDLSINSLH